MNQKKLSIQKLNNDIDAFFKKGGKVNKIKSGLSGNPEAKPLSAFSFKKRNNNDNKNSEAFDPSNAMPGNDNFPDMV